MRLLVVEDDSDLNQRLKTELSRSGFAVDIAENGIDAGFMGDEVPYDAVILDLGLPDRSGLDVLKGWRAKGNKVPVLILTARGAWFEKVEGFKAGADDYLSKPFHMEELVVRLNALIRRGKSQTQGTLQVGGIILDEERQCLTTRDGKVEELTGIEFRLLRYLLLHPDIVLSKSRITEHVYDFDSDKDSNVIEVYINRLRQKLGKEWIETRRGQGYIFKVPE